VQRSLTRPALRCYNVAFWHSDGLISGEALCIQILAISAKAGEAIRLFYEAFNWDDAEVGDEFRW